MKQYKPFKAAPNRREWFGFNLMQGHIFGIENYIPYVSGMETLPNGYIKAYVGRYDKNYVRWHTVAVRPDSTIGQKLLAAKAASPYEKVNVIEKFADLRTMTRKVKLKDGTEKWVTETFYTEWPPRSVGNNTSKRGHITGQKQRVYPVKTFTDTICEEVAKQKQPVESAPMAVTWTERKYY